MFVSPSRIITFFFPDKVSDIDTDPESGKLPWKNGACVTLSGPEDIRAPECIGQSGRTFSPLRRALSSPYPRARAQTGTSPRTCTPLQSCGTPVHGHRAMQGEGKPNLREKTVSHVPLRKSMHTGIYGVPQAGCLPTLPLLTQHGHTGQPGSLEAMCLSPRCEPAPLSC